MRTEMVRKDRMRGVPRSDGRTNSMRRRAQRHQGDCGITREARVRAQHRRVHRHQRERLHPTNERHAGGKPSSPRKYRKSRIRLPGRGRGIWEERSKTGLQVHRRLPPSKRTRGAHTDLVYNKFLQSKQGKKTNGSGNTQKPPEHYSDYIGYKKGGPKSWHIWGIWKGSTTAWPCK